MRISIMLPTFLDEGSGDPWGPTFEFARMVDELGFHMGTFGHHSFTPELGDPSAPFVVLAGAAAHTKNLRLGTGIYLTALHHPVTVAEQAATLDQVSGGRAVLGVGLGYRDYEYEGFGHDYADRAARLEESLAAMRQAWGAGRWGYDGKHFAIPDLPVHPACVQTPHVPILVGGSAKAAIRRAARLGDGWFALPQEPLDQMRKQADLYRQACAEAGTEPYICLMRNAWIAPTAEQVEAEWLPRMIEFHKTFSTARAGDSEDEVIDRLLAGEPFTFEEYVTGRSIAGTPEMCIEEIHRWHDAIEFDEISLLFGGSDDRGRLTEAVGQFGRDVVAAFR